MDRTVFETYGAPNPSQRCKKATSSSWTTCPPTKARLPSKPSASAALGSCFCRPYSPDLNPIEMTFAKLKAHLRAMVMCTIDELCKAIGQICDLFTPEEGANYFEAAGYGFK